MKRLLVITILLGITTVAQGVGNRVFEDFGALKDLGFEFERSGPLSDKLVSFTVTAPKDFHIEDAASTKPFVGTSFVQTLNKVEKGPKLISAPGSRLPLATKTAKDGRFVSWASVFVSDAPSSYIVFTFSHGASDWSMLIFVPVDAIAKHIQAEPDSARQPATAADSKSEGKEKPEPETRSQ